MSVVQMPSLPLDATGLPVRHKGAVDKATDTLLDMVNELPESVYHLGRQDAAWIIENVMAVYWHHLRREQR